MPTLAQIRQAIVDKMQGVAAIGRVHSYQRYETNLEALASLYRTEIAGNAQIRGWFVWRQATRRTSPSAGRKVITHTWRIRGWTSFSDSLATEIAFDTLIEALCLAFQDDETLGGVVASTVTEQAAGLQLDEQGPVRFAGVLCHGAQLTLYTRHYE